MHTNHDKNTLTDDYLLGTLLVEWGVIAPAELDLIRDECEGTSDAVQATKLATGVRRQLGELLCEVGHITPAQLDRALAEQRRTGRKLGAILVRMSLLTRPELDAALAFQTREDKPSGSSRLKLGEILVASGKITFAQLDAALEQQVTSGRRLGEELIAAGHVKLPDVERGLQIQQKLIAAIFASVLAVGSVSHSAPVDAGPARSALAVTTEVRPSVRMQSETLGAPLQIGADGGTFVATSSKTRTTSASLGYRFILNGHAQPGHYPWPLALRVKPHP